MNLRRLSVVLHNLAQVLEGISLCAALKEAQASEVRAFLERQ